MNQNQSLLKSKIPVIAILDIGKTNKKIFLFDEQYKIIYERTKQLPETADEDGFPCEDILALKDWVNEEIRLANGLEHLSIKAINVSAYGASFVHLDSEGKPIGQLGNYLKPYPEKLLSSFLSTYDRDQTLSLQTASPQLGSLNSGLQLYRLKQEQPSDFSKIKYSLHLPQYISFLLSGEVFTELTSIGCHTMLWDFRKNKYHEWVRQESIDSKFPELVSSSHVTKNNKMMTGVGLHDSSAALIPYLRAFHDSFTLISTGTWCISLNPFNQNPLTRMELELDCLQYLSFEGKPVKAIRLFAGHEHELMLKKIALYFNVDQRALHTLEFDKKIAAALINSKQGDNTEPNKLGQQDSGFDNRDLSEFKSFGEAYHQLLIDIVSQQLKSTALVLKNTNVKEIYVDGGFSTNSVYMNLLAAGFPQHDVYVASEAQGSALGAALAIHSAWNRHPTPKEIIKLRPCKRPDGVKIQPII